MKPKARMCDEQYAAVVAELVRLTLGGQPQRPELVAPLVEPNRKRRNAR